MMRACDLIDEILEEISACLACSGRASDLAERLTRLREQDGLTNEPTSAFEALNDSQP